MFSRKEFNTQSLAIFFLLRLNTGNEICCFGDFNNQILIILMLKFMNVYKVSDPIFNLINVILILFS